MTQIHTQTLPEGTRLGVYEIKKASKTGTFDITYRAWNHHLKEWVEIQEYFPHDFAIRTNDGLGVESKSPSDKENFEYGLKAFIDQAEILTQIEHPNIVKTENFLQFNGTAYLIRDYRENVPLYKLVRSPASFAETELKYILVTILNALQKVHDYKIIHGGIQPATIILGKNGEPLLTNFAIARLAIGERTAKLTGELAPGYAPPELYEHANEPGPATDFYALGATMYYCITHIQPIAAQLRKMALCKGEPDPMAALSGTLRTTYSEELLQAIDWMLRPEYNDRPQSVTEILALLKSEPINGQAGPITSKQEAIGAANSTPITKNHLGIGVISVLVGLVMAGLWLGKKPSEIIEDNASPVTSRTLFQGKPDVIYEYSPNAINEPGKQPKQAEEEMQLRESVNDNQQKNSRIAENKSFPTSRSDSKPELIDKIITEPESDISQPLAVIGNSQPQSQIQNPHEKPRDGELIKGYLAAARKAMKRVRLTTPARDNAHKYYKMVLAIDPDNEEARAGLQKIVDRYVWFIKKSSSEGKLNKAKRAFKKAESVLPNDPKLQSIRAELAVAKE